MLEDLHRPGLHPVGHLLDEPRPAQRIDRVGDAGLFGNDLLGPQGDLRRLLGGECVDLVERVRVQALRAAQHRRQRLDRRAHDVVLRLLGGQRHSRRLGVEAQLHRPLVPGPVAIPHPPGPDPAGGAELGDLLEEVDVRVEEERQARGERVDVEPAAHERLDVGEAVGEREGELLGGGRSRLADVVAGDRDRVPLRHLVRAKLHHVADESQVRFRWEHPLLLGDVLLQDVVLQRAAQVLPGDALLFGGHQQLGEQHLRRAVDRHRHGDPVERDLIEQRHHVVGRVDGHAAVPNLTERHGVVRVVPHQRRHVERHREPVLTLFEEVAEAGVGGGDVCEPGELPDGPQLAPVAGGMDAAGVREAAGESDALVDGVRSAHRRHVLERQRLEPLAPLGPRFVRRAPVASGHSSLPSLTATSTPQLGHTATSMSPTMNENPHASQVTFGDGGSGGGGGGGAPIGPAPGGGMPPAPGARTSFGEPHAGHVNRPGPGISTSLRHAPHLTLMSLPLQPLRSTAGTPPHPPARRAPGPRCSAPAVWRPSVPECTRPPGLCHPR